MQDDEKTEATERIEFHAGNIRSRNRREKVAQIGSRRAKRINLIMCFLTPYFSNTVDGEIIGIPGDCIFHSRGFKVRHGTPEGQAEGFSNDWVHLIGGPRVEELAARYGVPLDTVIRTRNPLCLREYILTIRREFYGRRPFWEDVVDQTLQRMIIALGRWVALLQSDRQSVEQEKRRDHFVECRTTLSRSLDRQWTLGDMAAIVGLSRDRFCVLYRQFFNVSPTEDLIRMRIGHARELLLDSGQPLEIIAAECGFRDVYYFNKTFKQRNGVPPGRYRREGVVEDI